MPRDSNGNYTLPPGNPVVTGEVISTGWANPTMSDVGAELTNSLDRQGRGGMLAPFKFVDGTNSQPGMTWTNEPTTGFYRAGGSDMRATVAGVARMRWTGTGVDVYDAVAGTWVALTNASGVNFALLNATNKFLQSQVIINTSASLQLWKDVTPTIGGRFAFNIGVADSTDLSHFNGTSWRPRFVFGAGSSSFYADAYGFFDEPGNLRRAYLDSSGFQVGSNGYAPVTGATRYIGMTGEAGNQTEIGVFANDGTNNPRAALWAAPTGVGLDWIFNTGISEFEFRRAGAVVFSYDDASIRLRSSPGRANTISWKADDNGAAYWNTTSGTTAWQWYLNSQILGAMSLSGLSLTTYTGAAVGNDLALNRTGGVGGNEVGQNAWLQLFNTDQGHGWGFQLASPGDGAGCRFYGYNGSWQERFRMDFNFMSFFWGGGVRLLDPSNAIAYILRLPSGGTSSSPCWDGYGASLWHHDATFKYGGIFVSTSPAPGTGGTPGQIWMQTDT